MKKVVSALTAATMCASMAAGAMSAFAAPYSADDVTFALRVTSTGGYTVSGNTITFASAADAANATFHVDQFLECGTDNTTIGTIGTHLVTSDNVVALSDGVTDNATSAKIYPEAKEYTLASSKGDVTVSTQAYVNCFSYADSRGKLASPAKVMVDQSEAQLVTSDGKEHLMWVWMWEPEKNPYGEAYAHFATANSDDLPYMGFDVTLGADIKDGTYTVDFLQDFDTQDPQMGVQPATYVKDNDGNLTYPKTKGLTIVVGDATDETKAPTEAPTDKPTEAPTDKPTENPGNTTSTDPVINGFTWSIDKKVVEAGQKGVPVEVKVYNSPDNVGGYTFGLTIDGKKGEDAVKSTTLKLADDIFQGPDDDSTPTAYSELALFERNPANLQVGGGGAASGTAEDGAAVMVFYFDIPEDAEPGTTWKLGIDEDQFTIKDNNSKPITGVSFDAGFLKIAGGEDPTEEPTEAETKAPTDAPTNAPTDDDDPNYLYGDLNKNGVVELVDIVILNRYLTGYEDQQLDEYQMEVANCQYDNKIDGADSVTILKHKIGLIETLPVGKK